jgi:uncharacterized DUF497 family protein
LGVHLALRFDWDETKRESNLLKHGFDFADAFRFFDGRPLFTYPSPRGNEARFVSEGVFDNGMLALVWLERDAVRRLISLKCAKKENIVSFTFEELEAKWAAGESRTDWARVDAMTQEEVERLADEEEGPLPEGWEKTVIIGLPPARTRSNSASTATCRNGSARPANSTKPA